MHIYLTGAQHSTKQNNGDNPQNDPTRSLGGFVSSSLAPSGDANALFGGLSMYTLERKPREVIALALINDSGGAVENVVLKTVVGVENIAEWRVGAERIDPERGSMTLVTSRYSLPQGIDFHDATFMRAYVEMEIICPGESGEEIALYPFNVVAAVGERGCEDESEWDATIRALEEGFSTSEEWRAVRVSERRVRIENRGAEIVEAQECEYITSGGFRAEWSGKVGNDGKTGEVLIAERMEAGEGVGLWLARKVPSSYSPPSSELLLFRHRIHYHEEETERMTLEVGYEIPTEEEVSGGEEETV